MSDDPQLAPVLTDDTPKAERVEGQGSVLNGGTVKVRKTHPNLFRMILAYGIINVALGINFWVFTPAFLVWGLPNSVWGTIFLALGVAKITSLAIYRNLTLVRATMALAVAYMLFFGAGTLEPTLQGKASAQLAILYAGLALLQIPLLLEPFINPWTAARDE
jgi:hypothetical protein